MELLKLHLEARWGKCTDQLRIPDPHKKIPLSFQVLEFPPSDGHNFWIYSTLGMSIDMDAHFIELHVFSQKQDSSLVELLTVTASFHRNDSPLGLHHSVFIGRPWQDNSLCDHAFLSLPYLDGVELETFDFGENHLHNLWLLPITEKERDYKMQQGWNALEELFEAKGLYYLDPNRVSCA
ncbi:suppressor of fused domain protein [Hymenobacter sp. BRD67]|uniref:suppressor of fused domain protein n=1 Tax=Hymenobacter sp. BRD67 TaxID=2675877 RepID=UPI0015638626|nr:suppressor of fused domain protein [Hymenobacter sp. BRD67]QKG53209.1 suppressor of fused domain protein [Hymenobacter sp. BRD67]